MCSPHDGQEFSTDSGLPLCEGQALVVKSVLAAPSVVAGGLNDLSLLCKHLGHPVFWFLTAGAQRQ